MRMPPLLADFIYNRVCELKCEKFLTRPTLSLFIYFSICETYSTLSKRLLGIFKDTQQFFLSWIKPALLL